MLESDQAILVTGAAGFIGFHVTSGCFGPVGASLDRTTSTPYYDPQLKRARLDILRNDPRVHFEKIVLADRRVINELFARPRFPVVIHLAAQAGVRYSLQDPDAYIDANLVGFTNIPEGCRYNDCRHLLFASSSSGYGANTKLPFSVRDNVDHPRPAPCRPIRGDTFIFTALPPSAGLTRSYRWDRMARRGGRVLRPTSAMTASMQSDHDGLARGSTP